MKETNKRRHEQRKMMTINAAASMLMVVTTVWAIHIGNIDRGYENKVWRWSKQATVYESNGNWQPMRIGNFSF